jgi:hypothetical protein
MQDISRDWGKYQYGPLVVVARRSHSSIPNRIKVKGQAASERRHCLPIQLARGRNRNGTKKGMQMSTTIAQTPLPPIAERLTVRRSLLANLVFKNAIAFNGDTAWEEVTCVGYNPASRQLVAVVSVKQATGYQGGLCVAGSTEYVRFFIDWGAGLTDVGLASFTAHDIPNAAPNQSHPIQYMVHLAVDDATHRRLCNSPVLPQVRATLSWNTIPSLNPNAVPFFGNWKE